MDGSALWPPNNRWMSDDVICNVIQRSRRAYHDQVTADDGESGNECKQTSFNQPKFNFILQSRLLNSNVGSSLLDIPDEHQDALDCNGASELADDVEQSTRPPTSTAYCTRPPSYFSLTSAAKAVTGPGGALAADKDTARALRSLETKAIEFRRQLGRSRQKRHRKKVLGRALSVENAVLLLREDIRKLKIQHRVVSSSVFVKTPWNVVAEYFRVFRKGLKGGRVRPNPSSTSGTHSSKESYIQWGFLCSTMASDVIGESGRGVEAFMKDWKRIMLVNEDFTTQLECLEAGPNDLMVANTNVTSSSALTLYVTRSFT